MKRLPDAAQRMRQASRRAKLLAVASGAMVTVGLLAAFTSSGVIHPAAILPRGILPWGTHHHGGHVWPPLGTPGHHHHRHAVPVAATYPAPRRTYPAPYRTYPAPPYRTYPAPPRRTYPAPQPAAVTSAPPPPTTPAPAPTTPKPTSPAPTTPAPKPTTPVPTTPAPSPPPRPGPAARPLEGVVTSAATGGVAGWDAATHHQADLAVSYVSMSQPLAPSFVHSVFRIDAGAEPVIEITLGTGAGAGGTGGSSVPLTSVLNGSLDSWLAGLRAQLNTAGKPVVISFGPEMNGGWYTWGRQPVNYVKAYRYVHAKLGTGGITYLWQVTSLKTADPTPYWPGSDVVDWAGLDGYYYFPGDNFDARFNFGLAAIAKFWHGPVIIGETGISPATKNVPNDIADLFAGVTSRQLLGLIYFDISQQCPPQGCGQFHGDFALQDGPPSWIAAYSQAVNGKW